MSLEMSLENRYNYDSVAFVYNSGTEISQIWLASLDKILLEHLPDRAHILDLCCGKGELIQGLLMKGYKVTGLDGSQAMLDSARENAPSGKFILDDARFFKLPSAFHAVLSVDASLNHVMSLEELTSVFHNVYAALLENGWFLFDLNREERFQSDWDSCESDFTDDYAHILRNKYDPEQKIGRMNHVLFSSINGAWQRSNFTILQKPYSTLEVRSALENVGFTQVTIYDAKQDFEIDSGANRMCYICRKQSNNETL